MQHLGAFIDVQNECLFYAALGVSPEFTGVFATYGTWPEVHTRYWTKSQGEGWAMMTREFFRAYPQHKATATKTQSGKVRAPLEAKIYHALSQCVPWLFGLDFVKQDQHESIMKIQRVAIDTRWQGDVVKRYIRESGYKDLVPYYGQAFPPTNKQLEEYQLTKGWFFEHQCHPNIKEPKWVIRPNPDGMFYMASDVNRHKDFLMARFASPPGSSGCLSIFEGTPDDHEMFADQRLRIRVSRTGFGPGADQESMDGAGRPAGITTGSIVAPGVAPSYLCWAHTCGRAGNDRR